MTVAPPDTAPPDGYVTVAPPAAGADLSDAFEEAGCTDADLLGHLRSAGPRQGLLGGGSNPGQAVTKRTVDALSRRACRVSLTLWVELTDARCRDGVD